MSEFDELNLHEPFLKGLQNLINGNQAKPEDLVEISHEIFDFEAMATVTWEFYGKREESKIAGGAKEQIHFGDDTRGYENHARECLLQARDSADLHEILLAELRQNANEAVAKSGGAVRYYDFKPFSMSERCDNCGGDGQTRCGECGGRGKKTCSSCGGRGRQSCSMCGGSGGVNRPHTQYNSDGSTYVTYRYESCSSCGGSGSNTCYGCSGSGTVRCGGCGGSGYVQCAQCSGHGYFTTVANIGAYAKPSVNLRIKSRAYADELLDFLCARTCKFISQTIPFYQDEESGDENSHLFSYVGSSAITRLNFILLGKEYEAVGFSNPPYAFIRPPFFDDLFADEISMLEKIDADGKITRREAFKFFTRYCSQPALDSALKRIAKTDGAQTEAANAVIEACEGYVSRGAASKLGETMKKCLNKISPVYSSAVWFGLGSVFWLIALVFTAGFLGENLAERYIMSPIYTIVFLALCAGVALCVLAPLSALVTLIRRSSVPKEYRQSMRNKEAFALFFKILAGFGAVGAIYGAISGFGYAPTLMQLDERFEASRSLEAKFREMTAKFEGSSDQEREANSTAADKTAPQMTQKEKILYVQKAIGVKADGIMGARTLKKAQKFLDANLTNADEIYEAVKAKEASRAK